LLNLPAIMLAIIAESALEFASLLCGVQIFSYRFTANTQKAIARTAFLLIAFAFADLVYSFAISDFSLKLVFENSHTLKPLIYKMSGTWGNHEGSMLLFLFLTSAYGQLIINDRKATATMGGVIGLFLGFIIISSNPFTQLAITPPEGMGLNPLLQDIGLAFHPPLLYSGYTGFAVVFALAIAILLRGEITKHDLKILRTVSTISWSFLTIGIAGGSWWAYRELGWGGFWFWDPVENSSLVPWFLATALIHCLIVTEKRGLFKKWVLLLSILTFLSCVAGFFLVRSGLLSSVHAFAVDPLRGYFILGILCLCAFPAFILYGIRSHKFESEGDYEFLSRESAIQFNNLLTVVISATVFLGTIFPFALDIFSEEKIAVGESFYNQTVAPLLLAVVVLSSIVLMAWHKTSLKLNSVMAWAHIGLLVMAIGAYTSYTFGQEKLLQLKVGESTDFAGKNFKLTDVVEGSETNYAFRRGLFSVDDHIVAPESRIYPIERQETTEAALYNTYLSDYYVVIGAKNPQEAYAVRLYFKPLITMLWLGALLMFIAGGIRVLRLLSLRGGKADAAI